MQESIVSRKTRAQKEENDKQWYKDKIDFYDRLSFFGNSVGFTDSGNYKAREYERMKINYDLFNNIINKADFEHVCQPFGKDVGDLPIDFTNKDIISGKIKALWGMELGRPFSWKVVAVNEEATTRKEQEEFSMLRDFVVNSIMAPIQNQIEQQIAQESQGKELSPDEQAKVQQQVAQELQTKTPPEVKRYMQREHQDPAEALAHQLLEYLMQKQSVKTKFNKGWKHATIAGKDLFWVGVVGGEPTLKVVNPLRFDYDKSTEIDYIEDAEWATYEMYMSPSEVSKYFGSVLTNKEIDEIYDEFNRATSPDASFNFGLEGSSMHGIRVVHCEWKALKPFKFVKGIDITTGQPYEDIVDESYKINREVGDTEVITEWIPTKYEGYLINSDKYALLREVPGQHKDLDNLYECKLSYMGAVIDDLNSEPTSIVDRMKYYQYMYNVISYRIELLIASDEGKVLFLNAGLIPKSSGISVEKWMYFLKVNKIGLMNPSEEGSKGSSNIGEAAKEVDLSLASDIQKYIQLAEYIERRCGESVGITKQVEGQIGSSEAVGNTQQALLQSANILEPYFELHNNVKRNVLQALLECAKVAYSEIKPKFLSYVLDDMSLRMLSVDYELLDNSTYGLFIANSMKSERALQKIEQLAQAALQNQRADMSDIAKIMRSESVQEAEELLMVAERTKEENAQAAQQQELKARAEAEEKAREFKREEWAFLMQKMEREEALKTERELQKQTILSLGFSEDKDADKDGTPDILEVYRAGVDADIKKSKLDLDREKLEQQKKEHTDKVGLEEKKIKAQAMKNSMRT